MVTIIHHNDLDGRCAAAIALRSKMLIKFKEIATIEMDYFKAELFNVELIPENEKLLILDFSFSQAKMEKIMGRTKDIIWIDHHKTAMEYEYAKTGGIVGIRREGISGCELTWLHFCKEAKMPSAVRFIGDRDTWTWKYGESTAKLNEGLKIFDTSPESKLWDDMLGKEKGLDSIMSTGSVVLRYKDQFCKSYLESFGYEVNFEGLKCMVLNLYTLGSESFGKSFKLYDACITSVYVGNKWQVSMYSKTHDVSVICKKYGGGGHPFASGFIAKELPFGKVDKNG